MHFLKSVRLMLSSVSLAVAMIATPAFADESPAPPAKAEGSKTKTNPHGSESAFGYSHGKSSGGEENPHKGKAEGSSSKTDAPYYKEGSSYGSAHGGSGYSHGHGHQSGHNPFRHVLAFAKELGLTDEQTDAIKNQQLEYEKSRIRSEADHKIAHLELGKLIHSENIDEAKVRELTGKITNTIDGMIKASIEAKLTVMRTLTPDQRKKVNKMFSEHR